MESGNTVDILNVIIPSLVSIIGFVVTIIVNSNNLKRAVAKRQLEQYWDSYKSIEYDIAEILQLSLNQYLENPPLFPYNIQKHRNGEFAETADIAERLYRLAGYISTYGSTKTMQALNSLKRMHNLKLNNSKSVANNDLCKFLSMLAIFLMYIKQDIFKQTEGNISTNAILWLELRLPVSFYNANNKILYEDIISYKI